MILQALWSSLGHVIIDFRWKHDLRRIKELWLDELPRGYSNTVHSYAISTLEAQNICDALGLGDYADIIDEKERFETIKVLAHTGFSRDDLSFLRFRPIGEMVDGMCVMLPQRILNEAFTSEENIFVIQSHDRSKIPTTVKIHYGKGEKPFWMEARFLMEDPYRNPWDPLNPLGEINHEYYGRFTPA